MTTTTTSPTGPAPLARQVRAGVAALLSGAPGTGAGGWTGEEREAVVAELDAAIQELTVYRGLVLLAHRKDGRWGSVQDRDFADYRSRSTGIGRGAALGDLRLAEGLEAMPAVAEAVERGEVTLEHARALTRLREKASPEVQDALAGGGLDTLLERATSRGLTAPELGTEAKAWAAGWTPLPRRPSSRPSAAAGPSPCARTPAGWPGSSSSTPSPVTSSASRWRPSPAGPRPTTTAPVSSGWPTPCPPWRAGPCRWARTSTVRRCGHTWPCSSRRRRGSASSRGGARSRPVPTGHVRRGRTWRPGSWRTARSCPSGSWSGSCATAR